ncbi:hypothetical protein ACFLTH_12775, partial [Bacteroidota bacterium]
MKKRIFILLLLVIAVFVQAQTYVYPPKDPLLIDSASPILEITFDENVTLDDGYIDMISPSGEKIKIGITNETNDNMTFLIKAEINLFNGNYKLHIFVSDYFGNQAEVIQPFTIEAPVMEIWVEEPHLGVSKTKVFDLIVASEEISNCSWHPIFPINNIYNFDFDREPGLTHELDQINNNSNNSSFEMFRKSPDKDGKERMFYVRCEDKIEVLHYEDLYLAYDTSPPSLEVTVVTSNGNPNNVTDPSYPFATIVLDTNDRTVCSYLENGQPGTFEGYDLDNFSSYKKNHELFLDFTSLAERDADDDLWNEEEYLYEINCTNLAGHTNITNIKVTVVFEQNFGITMISPDRYTSEGNIDLVIQTSIEAAGCMYGVGTPNQDFPPPVGRNYTANLGPLDEGDYNYQVRCLGLTNQIQYFTFTVDRTKPTDVSVNVETPTCSLDEIRGNITGEDEISGIDYFKYFITQGGVYIENGTMDDGPFTEKVDLNLGDNYMINIIAYDKAGKFEEASDSFIATNSTSPLCDKDSPTTNITSFPTLDGVSIKVHCEDTATGCDTTFFRYGFSRTSDTCELTEIGSLESQNILTENDIYFCWTVFDLAFPITNNASGFEFVPYINITKILPDHCFNEVIDENETGLNCGGDCLPCDDGENCYEDIDCSNGWCDDGVCKLPTCTDGELNGNEEGFDCGGDCLYECPTCGNNIPEAGEDCDLGDTQNGNGLGCASDCTYECDINVGSGCPAGTQLCIDNSCSMNCGACEKELSVCLNTNGVPGTPDGVCSIGEGCACPDCISEQDSCQNNFECAIVGSTGLCCDTEGFDGICNNPCFAVDPDCGENLNLNCGDGDIDFGEECDLGTDNGPGSGCSDDCTIECGLTSCPLGTNLCDDGTCSISCTACGLNPTGCNNDGTCDSGEGCSCGDCEGLTDSCNTGLVCGFSSGYHSCCSIVSDNECTYTCVSVDPDCKFGCTSNSDCESDEICNSENVCEASNEELDSDGDGIPDYWEDKNGLDKNDPTDADEDPDNDGFTNFEEYLAGTNPHDPNNNPDTDSDGDGMPDYWEEENGLNKNDPSDANKDTDRDGFTNLEEYNAGTDPNDANSTPYQEEKEANPIALVFIIIGLLLIIAGIVFLIFERRKQEKEKKKQQLQTRLVDEKGKSPMPGELMGFDDTKTSDPSKGSELFKKRMDKRKGKRQNLLGAFEEKEEEEKGEEKKKKKSSDIFKEEIKLSSPKKKSEKKLDEGEELDKEGFLEITKLHKDDDVKKEDIGKDVFQELEIIGKKSEESKQDEEIYEKKKTSKKPELETEYSNKKKKLPLKIDQKKESEDKDKEGKIITKEKPETKSNDDIFKQLAELSGQTHTNVKKTIDKKDVSSKDYYIFRQNLLYH